MMQSVAKLIAILAFFGLLTPLTITLTYLEAIMGTNNVDIHG
jgi:hypothetical protein